MQRFNSARRFALLFVLVLTATAPLTRAAESSPRATAAAASASDAARLQALISEQVSAWQAADAKAFAAGFTADASLTTIRGTVMYGRQAVQDLHEQIFTKLYVGSRLSLTIGKIIFVRPDVAIADIAMEISNLGGKTSPGTQLTPEGNIRTRLQEVFVRNDGRWQVASFHNVDVKQQ